MGDELLVGAADIAAAVRREPKEILRWADPAGWDPLRLNVYDGDRVQILRSRLEAWRRRNLLGGEGEVVLLGWDRIAARAHKSRRAAIAASQRAADPLPVQREKDGTIWAYASAIDDWVYARTWTFAAHRLALTARTGESRDPKRRKRRRWTRAEKPKGMRGLPASPHAREEQTATLVPVTCQEGSTERAQ